MSLGCARRIGRKWHKKLQNNMAPLLFDMTPGCLDTNTRLNVLYYHKSTTTDDDQLCLFIAFWIHTYASVLVGRFTLMTQTKGYNEKLIKDHCCIPPHSRQYHRSLSARPGYRPPIVKVFKKELNSPGSRVCIWASLKSRASWHSEPCCVVKHVFEQSHSLKWGKSE